jgi:hypothetical protein
MRTPLTPERKERPPVRVSRRISLPRRSDTHQEEVTPSPRLRVPLPGSSDRVITSYSLHNRIRNHRSIIPRLRRLKRARFPYGFARLKEGSRYSPYGVAFSKDFVFAAGGGPAFYVRGDEWREISGLPPEMQARCTRYWPGAEPEFPDEDTYGSASEWAHEREWRVVGSGNPPAFRFQPEDVSFLLIPRWEERVEGYPCVRLDRPTGNIEDSDAAWLPHEPNSTLRAS